MRSKYQGEVGELFTKAQDSVDPDQLDVLAHQMALCSVDAASKVIDHLEHDRLDLAYATAGDVKDALHWATWTKAKAWRIRAEL